MVPMAARPKGKTPGFVFDDQAKNTQAVPTSIYCDHSNNKTVIV
jgi:hypothetical protein